MTKPDAPDQRSVVEAALRFYRDAVQRGVPADDAAQLAETTDWTAVITMGRKQSGFRRTMQVCYQLSREAVAATLAKTPDLYLISIGLVEARLSGDDTAARALVPAEIEMYELQALLQAQAGVTAAILQSFAKGNEREILAAVREHAVTIPTPGADDQEGEQQ